MDWLKRHNNRKPWLWDQVAQKYTSYASLHSWNHMWFNELHALVEQYCDIFIYIYIYICKSFIYIYIITVYIYILIGRNRNTHRRSQDILHNAVRMAMLVVKLKARTTPPDLFCISPGIKFVFVEKNDTPNPVVYLHFPKHIANLS